MAVTKLLLGLGALAVATGLVLSLQKRATQPNIVVILCDDLDVFTDDEAAAFLPNIKTQIIDEGMTFDKFYITQPICAPSRATFFRGQYAHNTGLVANDSAIEEGAITKWADDRNGPSLESNHLAIEPAWWGNI